MKKKNTFQQSRVGKIFILLLIIPLIALSAERKGSSSQNNQLVKAENLGASILAVFKELSSGKRLTNLPNLDNKDYQLLVQLANNHHALQESLNSWLLIKKQYIKVSDKIKTLMPQGYLEFAKGTDHEHYTMLDFSPLAEKSAAAMNLLLTHKKIFFYSRDAIMQNATTNAVANNLNSREYNDFIHYCKNHADQTVRTIGHILKLEKNKSGLALREKQFITEDFRHKLINHYFFIKSLSYPSRLGSLARSLHIPINLDLSVQIWSMIFSANDEKADEFSLKDIENLEQLGKNYNCAAVATALEDIAKKNKKLNTNTLTTQIAQLRADKNLHPDNELPIKTKNTEKKIKPLSASVNHEEYTVLYNSGHQKKIIIFNVERDKNYTGIDNRYCKNITYTDWVTAWFKDPNKALKTQGYDNINNCVKYSATDAKEQEIIFIHAFDKVVDEYIGTHGIQTSIESKKHVGQKDIMITIPAAIEATPDAPIEFGIFVYLFDSNTGMCYHRNFSKKTSDHMIKEFYSKGFYEYAFPELQ